MVITTLYDWSLLTYTKLEIILLHFIVEWSDNKFIWTVLFTPSSFRSSQETLMAVKWSNTSFYLSSQQISWDLLLKNVKLPTFVAWEWKSTYQVRTMKKKLKENNFCPSARSLLQWGFTKTLMWDATDDLLSCITCIRTVSFQCHSVWATKAKEKFAACTWSLHEIAVAKR